MTLHWRSFTSVTSGNHILPLPLTRQIPPLGDSHGKDMLWQSGQARGEGNCFTGFIELVKPRGFQIWKLVGFLILLGLCLSLT